MDPDEPAAFSVRELMAAKIRPAASSIFPESDFII
jgi:hypothetical protein